MEETWMDTYTGQRYDVFKMMQYIDSINIVDIAHALSMMCRYNGHCNRFFSVAQHSMIAANLVAMEHPTNIKVQFATLLHDASEAYIADIIRPIKPRIQGYKELEKCVSDAVYCRFGIHEAVPAGPTMVGINYGLTEEDEKIIKWADDTCLATECVSLMASQGKGYSLQESADDRIKPAIESEMTPDMAEVAFKSQADKYIALMNGTERQFTEITEDNKYALEEDVRGKEYELDQR